MIGLLDIGMGNLRSVYNAVYSLGFDIEPLDSSLRFEDISHLILPGVGSFRTAMQEIDSRGLREAIVSFAAKGCPVLGLCLGMQLLADYGEEGGGTSGLGLIPGRVLRLDLSPGLRLPHVGWNTVRIVRQHPVFEHLKNSFDCYFVHTYHLQCLNAEQALAETDYGVDFTSIAGSANVIGFQFHPEKSQASGLRMLENFCNWDGLC
jgi:imidazole glycerol-phosphate synthase subunit HisH